jgi:hypothetical protein
MLTAIHGPGLPGLPDDPTGAVAAPDPPVIPQVYDAWRDCG